MKTRIALFALSLIALPLTAAQTASAEPYGAQVARDRAHIVHHRRQIQKDKQEAAYYAGRQAQAARDGNYGAARYFGHKKRQEQAQIHEQRRKLWRDRAELRRDRYWRNHY
ncbi:hypothetical protein [Rhodomicrobium udaipurense]|uniref:Uncharacterized protein n=1 Tax=Rhodomicrobium udaipurense TaxID=1202716 RepID=A0A8I1GI34_9HYPH|nr:hypothetical protein [Rhodomicrobium udaipurense]MBJ7544746.1 hypothetical protein [Rhodomicrobium udaipurense]